ncbi:MAG: hypothetical protein ACYC5F_03985 [Thermoleophilia bacterium]
MSNMLTAGRSCTSAPRDLASSDSPFSLAAGLTSFLSEIVTGISQTVVGIHRMKSTFHMGKLNPLKGASADRGWKDAN